MMIVLLFTNYHYYSLHKMGYRHKHNYHTSFVIKLLYLCCCCCCFLYPNKSCAEAIDVHVGVVLDLNSPLGSMADLCMRMAISDYYEANPNSTTGLKLHTKNARSLLDANFAAIDLLKHEQVHGIIGPDKELENPFIAELGEKVHVPVISFTESSSAAHVDSQYVVRTTTDETVQARALAAICKGFGWPAVAVLYEDSSHGNQFLSNLNEALKDVDVGLAYMTAMPTTITNSHLGKELRKLAMKQTRAFLVHMSPSLGYRLFSLAKQEGVMGEGYAWIISDSLSNFVSSVDYATRDSMEGVVGIRPHVYRSKELEDFQERWKRNKILAEGKSPDMELNIYGLRAYDAVTALAIAVERIGPVNSTSLHVNATQNGTDHSSLRISAFGPELLVELSRTRFRGLAGDFQLVDGRVKQSDFEIFNIYGSGEKTIGYWTPNRGITRDLSLGGEGNYSTSVEVLKTIVWPGDSTTRPKGWDIPATGILRVGIPWKLGFREFVNITVDGPRNHTDVTGFAIDIFLATLDFMPYPINYEFHYYNDTENLNWSYDDMLTGIPQKFDMVVGDTTIWAPRATHVDFSLPFSESGVVLVVKNKKSFDTWIFVKPLRWDLWVAILVACVLMGIVLHILERRVPRNYEDPMRSCKEKPGNIYLSPVSFLAFPERNMVSNNWSFFVLVCWMFMAFILMQSYTANLSAILTVDQLKFAFSDNYYVGFQEASFMREFLIEQLHISESRLRSYSSPEEYHDAMSLGSNRGGIDAIFDEIPYMKIFLNKYDSQYKIVGPTYRTGGFGFAFPTGSPLVSPMSKAIMNVTQGPEMTRIEQTNFGPGYSSQDPLSSRISQGASSLTFHDFAGMFIIIGSVVILSLFCSETPIGRKLTEKSSSFVQFCLHFKTFKVNATDASIDGDSLEFGGDEIWENNPTAPAVGEGTDTVVTEQVSALSATIGGGVHESSQSGETSSEESGTAFDDTTEQGVRRNQ